MTRVLVTGVLGGSSDPATVGTHALTGPDSVTLPRTAQLLAGALDRPVAHLGLAIDEAVAGLEGFARQLTASTYERVHAGVYAGTTDAVERTTWRPPRSLASFLAELRPGRDQGGHGREGRAAPPTLRE